MLSDRLRRAHYHDLEAVLEAAWALLDGGANDRRSGFHIAQVATIDEGGVPSLRSVVLRGFDPRSRVVRFHTDGRSRKVREITARPKIAMHLYDRSEKIQLRLICEARVHRRDTVSETAWRGMQTMSRVCYAQNFAPGSVLQTPQSASTELLDTAIAEQNFAVVTAQILSLEWLYLSAEGHRRARFDWNGSAEMRSWLAP